MQIAITGASGHVGNCLCKELNKMNIKPRVLLHRDENDFANMQVEPVPGDVLNRDSLKNLIRGTDVVFHLAARISIDNRDRDQVFRINEQGTGNVVQLCSEIGGVKLVHFSSIHALDPFPFNEPLNESRPYARDISLAYEQSKIAGEKIVREAVNHGLHAVVINPTAIIGPYDHKPSYLGQALIKMYNNRLPMLIPGGYNWVDVRDVVQGAIRAMERGKPGDRYILAGKWVSLRDLSGMIGQITGRNTPRVVVPSQLTKIGAPFIRAYARLMKEHPLYTPEVLDILRLSHPDILSVKAADELGYTSRPLEETLLDTFAWYKQHQLINA